MIEAPPVQRLGQAVLLQGVAVADLAYLVDVGLRAVEQRDAVAPRGRWLTLRRMLREVVADLAIADSGSAALPQGPGRAESSLGLITTKEAAVILNLQERQVRNLAAVLGGQRAGRAWFFDRSAVHAEALRRAAVEEAR